MQRETAGKWGVEEPAKPAPEKPSSATAEAPAPEAKAGADDDSTPAPAGAPEAKDKKKNPWALLREEKARSEKLEREVQEVRTKGMDPAEKTEYLTKLEKAEAKLKEYEQEIQFKAYEKSQEYQDKYEKPYTQAWSKHMRDLRGVTVQAEDGSSRPMEAQDMLDLVNLELPDARALAKAKWGDFADDVMIARKEIRNLFEAKRDALDEARKTGAQREKENNDRSQKWATETNAHVRTTWDEANKAALNDPNNGEFFKPAEGDETRNQLLGKGFALVDKAFSENPMDPKLTPEQRADVVRRHAAVRNRAAAFGPMKYLVKKLQNEIDELRKLNEKFKGSTPTTAGGTNTASAPASGKARDRMHNAGDKYAR